MSVGDDLNSIMTEQDTGYRKVVLVMMALALIGTAGFSGTNIGYAASQAGLVSQDKAEDMSHVAGGIVAAGGGTAAAASAAGAAAVAATGGGAAAGAGAAIA